MSVAYSESSTMSSEKMPDAACLDAVERAVTDDADGRNGNSRKPVSKRTPEASESLFSMDGFAVADADELRGLMHASLKGFAVEMGVQIAAHLLEEDVVRLCGQKN